MKHVAILAALVAVFLFFALPRISSEPFAYDEADYMFAARQGFVANYLDRPSYSFAEYVRLGLSKGRDAGQKSDLSQTVRRSGDIFFFRHAHGPMYFYWLAALSRWSTNEHFVRSFGLVFPLLTSLVIYLGCLYLLPPPGNQFGAALSAALYLLSPAVIRTSEVAPHQMFVLWFVVSLMALAALLNTGERRFWYAAAAATAVAFCTLEVAFVLIAALGVCGFLERERLGWNRALALRSVALFAGCVILLHPAELTKLAFAKSYLFYAYLALRRKAAWGDATLAGSWLDRLRSSPVEWALIAVAIFAWLRMREAAPRRTALPFLLFGALMLAVMLRVIASGPRYSLPYLPALHVFAGIVLAESLTRLPAMTRYLAVAAAAGALVLNAQWYMAIHPFQPDGLTSRVIGEIRHGGLESARLLSPAGLAPSLHYYFPNADVTPYQDAADLPSGQFDAIVHIDRRTSPVELLAR
jgi:hypothetical protein